MATGRVVLARETVFETCTECEWAKTRTPPRYIHEYGQCKLVYQVNLEPRRIVGPGIEGSVCTVIGIKVAKTAVHGADVNRIEMVNRRVKGVPVKARMCWAQKS